MRSIEIVVGRWEDSLRVALRRYQLIFVQTGAIYSPLCANVLARVGSESHVALDLAKAELSTLSDSGTVVVTATEMFADSRSPLSAPTLGELRIRVEKLLELGAKVCLASTAPRCAYPAVPGSSVIEDAKPFVFGVLSAEEIPLEFRQGGESYTPAGLLPAISLLGKEVGDVYREALRELGVNVLAAVDHAVFDVGAR